jgi:hypothetical protein
MNDTAQITMSSKQLEKVIAALDTALGVCQLVGADRKPIDLDDCYAGRPVCLGWRAQRILSTAPQGESVA